MTNDPSSWTDLIGESVHTSDDQDIGDIEAVSTNFLVVKKGLVSVRRYYIPLHRVEGWDGRVVWLRVSEEAVRKNYEINVAPDPYVYHYSSAPTVDPSTLVRRFQINMPKIPPRAKEDGPFLVSQGSPSREKKKEEHIFKCILCNTTFKSDDELSNHVQSAH